MENETPPLSLEYRPGYLCPGKSVGSKDTEYLPNNPEELKNNLEDLQEYLTKLQSKLQQQAEVYARLRKVGGKRVSPTAKLQVPPSPSPGPSSSSAVSSTVAFQWDAFKQDAKRRIGNMALDDKTGQQILDKINKDDKEQIITKLSKFDVYAGWKCEQNTGDSNIFYLRNPENGSDQYIEIKYNKDTNKVDITTTKKHMQDDKVMAIMLEVARNVQRYTGNFEDIEKINLPDVGGTEETQTINSKLNKYAKVLNTGVDEYFSSEGKKDGRPVPDSAIGKDYKIKFKKNNY